MPQGRVVDHLNNELGPTGSPLILETNKYGGYVEFEIRREGFHPHFFQLRKQQLLKVDQWPKKGSIVLEPDGLGSMLKHYVANNVPAIITISILLGVGLKLSVDYRGKLKSESLRVERLARYESQTGTNDPMILKVLGGYRVVSSIGEGGMATVYRALPEATLDESEAVAVKILKGNLDEEDLERFKREIGAYVKLSHPNIVRLINWGSVEDRTFLILEYIQGETLGKFVKRTRPTLHEAVALLRPMMGALGYAHSQGFVHRDLKPENIMVSKSGRLVVMDFGLARSEDAEKLTKTGTAMGTPMYMAPEQIAGTVDPRSDQYALGIIAYLMLTERPPFQAKDIHGILLAHLSMAPDPITEVPEAISSVIMKMLEKAPDSRYDTLSDAWCALESALP